MSHRPRLIHPARVCASCSGGQGLLVARKPGSQEWCLPVALGLGGVGAGLQVGFHQEYQIALLMSDEAVKLMLQARTRFVGGRGLCRAQGHRTPSLPGLLPIAKTCDIRYAMFSLARRFHAWVPGTSSHTMSVCLVQDNIKYAADLVLAAGPVGRQLTDTTHFGANKEKVGWAWSGLGYIVMVACAAGECSPLAQCLRVGL